IRGGLGSDLLYGEVEELRVVAAVVDVSAATCGQAGGVGHLLRRDEISAPQLDAIHLQLCRQCVHRSFDRVVAQWPAAAADEAGGAGVGVDENGLDVHRREEVGRDHVADDDYGLAGYRSPGGADVVDDTAQQSAKPHVSVRGDLPIT